MGASSVICGNEFYQNNFIDNMRQIVLSISSSQEVTLDNAWDNGGEGNYWSGYNGADVNGDGIGDSEYIIAHRMT